MSLGLNVGKLAVGLLQQVNKNDTVTLRQWTGQTINLAGIATSAYVTTTGIKAQIQPIGNQELKHKNYYNDNGIYKKFYFVNKEDIKGLNRQIQKAGDYILWNGFAYKIMEYLENFESGWISIIGAQGIDETTP